MHRRGVHQVDDDIVTSDRKVTVNTPDAPPSSHDEPDLHQKCQAAKTLGDKYFPRINCPRYALLALAAASRETVMRCTRAKRLGRAGRKAAGFFESDGATLR